MTPITWPRSGSPNDIARAKVAGLSIRARAAIRGDAPQLLLTNAWPQSIRCWDRHWDALAEQFSLLAIDLPGFGLSEGRRSVMAPIAQADILSTIIASLDRGAVTVVAPDVGVPAALALAQEHPHLVDGLVLFNGPTHFPPGMSWTLAMAGRSRIYRSMLRYSGGVFAAVAFQFGYRIARPSMSALREYFQLSAAPRRFGLTLDYQASYAAELPLIQARLTEVTAPTLLPWGVDDPFIHLSEGQRIAAALPNSHWAPMIGCGHFAHEDAGDRFTQTLLDWHASQVTSEPEVS
jgi:pimeloyl-ACP methyl ester carboxylesterase